MERFVFADSPPEDSPTYRLGQQKDGCVGNTIASLCSTITGEKVELPPMYYHYRGAQIMDMVRLYARHRRRDRDNSRQTDKPELALHRLDQQIFTKTFNSIKENKGVFTDSIPLELAIEESEIEYRRGDMTQILDAVNSGWEVAVSFKVPDENSDAEAWHMAHIGKSQEGQLVRISDNNEAVTEGTVKSINEAAKYLNAKVRTWNFVAIRRSY